MVKLTSKLFIDKNIDEQEAANELVNWLKVSKKPGGGQIFAHPTLHSLISTRLRAAA